jgi:hypothetical protein
MKSRQPTRKRLLIGAHVDQLLFRAVLTWKSASPERTASMFLRDAVREKLRRDGVLIHESK